MIGATQEVQTLHNNLKNTGEELATNHIPQIILDLTKLYDTHKKILNDCDEKTDFKQKCVETIKINKPHLKKLMDHCQELYMWVVLSTPKIEGGNNFGVEIQDHIMKYISDVLRLTEESYTRQLNYFSTRGKFVSKSEKWPKATDYIMFIREFDEREYVQFVGIILQMRDNYSILYDLIIKNLEKLKKPKSVDIEEGQADYYR